MFNDTIVSLIRTWIPIAVGFVVVQLAGWGIEADASVLNQAIIPIVSGAYYAVARALEKVHPFFGWLLGAPKTPTYG